MNKIYRIHPKDNVAVALEALRAGDSVDAGSGALVLRSHVPAGHKVALCDIPQGENVVKYGFPIGTASCGIAAGDWVHTHNTATRLGGKLEYRYEPDFRPLPPQKPAVFSGYRRKDGKVGIRNEVWIVPTVGCVNAIAQQIAEEARRALPSGVDGVYAFPHPYGCSQLSQDLLNTQLALCGLIRHPNAGGVLVLGLGCENNTMDEMKKILGPFDENRVKFLICQEQEDEIAAGVGAVRELCAYAAGFRREPCGADELVVGLKCGGSDGFSGITANPLVGSFSDRLVAQGGTAILTEVPEMFGAETLLMNRCKNESVFRQTVGLINNFKQYFMDHRQKIDSNPSPGNKAGGITTLEDKSLGCVQKGGTAPVCGVLDYGMPVTEKGLNLLQGPGNDLVAATALAVSGAHLVLFTTGRGTPFGCPVPTVKISSNSDLARRKKEWIDFNAGRLLTGENMPDLSDEFFRYVLDVASGKKAAKSERFGEHGVAIFKNGVTL